MTKKKKVQEKQPVIAQTVKAKKNYSKKKETEEKVIIVSQEQLEKAVNEDVELSPLDDDYILVKDYSIEDFMEALVQKNVQSEIKEKTTSDKIFEKFDELLEEKGLGKNYFQKLEKQVKEMELEHELHEFAIDEMLNE